MNVKSLVFLGPNYIGHRIHFYLYKNRLLKENGNKPVIFFNLNKPHIYKRYLYTLIKFFNLEGFEVWFPNDFEIFRNIRNADIYLNFILKENLIRFKNPEDPRVTIEFNKYNLSADYFSFLNSSPKKNEFRIPMTMHPLFYNKSIWQNEILNKGLRKNSIFMIGNFDKMAYRTIEKSYFNVKSRIEIFKFLNDRDYITHYKTEKSLLNFINGEEDKKCIIIQRKHFSISVENLRPILGAFNFYLACPGVAIPYSHNIIEAMSVGCIPLIEENYALMMQPPLEDMKNAILFKDFTDICNKIKYAYDLPESSVNEMRKNVLNYYNRHLTPSAVINNLMHKEFEMYYLQAEFESAKLYRYSSILQDLKN